jgi:hypothetical protein
LAGRLLKLTAEQHVSYTPALTNSVTAVLTQDVIAGCWPTRLSLD